MLWGLALLALWAWPGTNGEWTQLLLLVRRDQEEAALTASNPSTH